MHVKVYTSKKKEMNVNDYILARYSTKTVLLSFDLSLADTGGVTRYLLVLLQKEGQEIRL